MQIDNLYVLQCKYAQYLGIPWTISRYFINLLDLHPFSINIMCLLNNNTHSRYIETRHNTRLDDDEDSFAVVMLCCWLGCNEIEEAHLQ